MKKVIITCAVTGSVHTPSMSPYLPYKPQDIASQAIAAVEAGAAILHLHARNPENGKPSADPADFLSYLPEIKAATNAVINITTGGSAQMTVDERIAAAMRLKPEMASLNMGTMNFSFHPLANKFNWQHDWEKPYIEGSEDGIFRNTFKDIRRILSDVGEGCGTKFEFECYDVSHLYNLAHFVDLGLIKPPFLIQTIFGIMGGIGADPENVAFMRETANRLFGRDYHWSILGAGRSQIPLLTYGAIMGGNVRVGLEDSLFLGRGKLATSNAEQVTKIKRILEELSIETATPDEARDILKLKGSANVAF